MNFYLLQNYLTLIFRNLRRNKLFSLINVLGLGIGLAVTFYISLFITHELSYENMHSKADRIFRVSMHLHDGDYDTHWARVDRDLVNQLPESFPEIEQLVRFQNFWPRNIQVGLDNYKLSHAYTTDAAVFKVFDFKLLKGDPETALRKPHSVVLTESIARRFFGDKEAMNREITIPNEFNFEKQRFIVTGIMKDLPSNTHLPVNLLTSFGSPQERTGWAYTYLLCKNAEAATEIQQKMRSFIKKHTKPDVAVTTDLLLQHLPDIHLQSDLAREIIPNGNMSRIYLFGCVGLFILLMSTINFINLNAVQSLKRGKEIGVRMLLGSARRHLIAYFLLEALLITSLAALLGLFLTVNLLPFFRELTPIATPWWMVLPLMLLEIILISLLAGFYPAFMLSRLKPVIVLKNKEVISQAGRHWNPKNVLVAFQLILCITLISSALITQSQFTFLMHKNLGLDKEQVLTMSGITQPLRTKYDFLKTQLHQIPGIKGVSAVMQTPSQEIRDTGPVYAEGKTESLQDQPAMDGQIVDADFIRLMDVKLLAGRNFRERKLSAAEKKLTETDPLKYLTSQSREYIINETALKTIGWKTPEEALGKNINWSIGGINLQKGPVVGVIQDFHQESLKNKVDPLVLFVEPYWLGNLLIKMDGKNVSAGLQAIENLWKKNFPDLAFEYAFLDDLYNRLYETEQKQLHLIYLFSGLAVVIAFLGIFGLLAYTLKTREKEIAIRKVLGADLRTIMILLSKKFVLYTLLGMLVAAPLTWIAMNQWLQNFAYHMDIQLINFLIPLVLILAVLLLTISVQLRKVALENPAEVLRAE